MKFPSRGGHRSQGPGSVWMVLLFIGLLAPAQAAPGLFSALPEGDQAYSQLSQLEKAGLLAPGASSGPLTRFEVAQRILKAQRAYYRGIVVAQAEDVPPPSADTDATLNAALSAPSAAPVAAAPSSAAPAAAPAAAAPAALTEAQRAQAERNLSSLSEAYQFELKQVQDEVQAVKDRAAAVDASQYEIYQKLKGFTDYPNVAFHGTGRAFAFSRQWYGDYNYTDPGLRQTWGYLDLNPVGAISKQVKWDAILRFQTLFEPDLSTDSMAFRRITMVFSPEWFTATVGDFYESYTPFTLWNRNDLDLMYEPEMIARRDRDEKYESFFDREPDWPFRGLRVGTDLAFTESPVLDRLQASVFANMISNGFDADTKNGTFFGPAKFTDWIFAGRAALDSKKWYVSNLTFQLDLAAQGIVLDEPLDTNAPGALYSTTDPSTWAHQYLIGSWTPDFRIGFGSALVLGFTGDLAFSSYQDDKRDSSKIISDYAAAGGAYLQLEKSRLAFKFMDVGPYFYSPLAQSRQDIVAGSTLRDTPEIFQNPLRSRFFLTTVPRASGIFGFYDRTQDNTFPYGLATPNRQGFGFDLDVKALKKDALKIKGAAYFLQEISGNLVSNIPQTALTVLDGTTAVPIPMRTFTYVNVGPSINLGPLAGMDRDLEVGTNVRFENTTSGLGALNSAWVLGGLKVGVLPGWDVSGAYSYKKSVGQEAGFGGTTWARYAYLYDNSDINPPLGLGYSVFNVDMVSKGFKLSTAFRPDNNSSFYLDYSSMTGNMTPFGSLLGTLNNQYMELTYEIEF